MLPSGNALVPRAVERFCARGGGAGPSHAGDLRPPALVPNGLVAGGPLCAAAVGGGCGGAAAFNARKSASVFGAEGRATAGV